MIWSHHGPTLFVLDFSCWDGSWDGQVVIMDFGYVVLPRE